jgi:hypothetical protein
MAIVTLRLPLVKALAETRPDHCVHCRSPLLQRWGGRFRTVKDTHIHQALVYRYRCCQYKRTFRHYPDGITSALQS